MKILVAPKVVWRGDSLVITDMYIQSASPLYIGEKFNIRFRGICITGVCPLAEFKHMCYLCSVDGIYQRERRDDNIQ